MSDRFDNKLEYEARMQEAIKNIDKFDWKSMTEIGKKITKEWDHTIDKLKCKDVGEKINEHNQTETMDERFDYNRRTRDRRPAGSGSGCSGPTLSLSPRQLSNHRRSYSQQSCRGPHHATQLKMSNSAVKIAPFGRWTPQKRGALYLGR